MTKSMIKRVQIDIAVNGSGIRNNVYVSRAYIETEPDQLDTHFYHRNITFATVRRCQRAQLALMEIKTGGGVD
jgi:hypothetical protein